MPNQLRAQSSLFKKYLRKCEDIYFVEQNMYLRIYEGTYGQRYFEMIEHLEYMILTLYLCMYALTFMV